VNRTRLGARPAVECWSVMPQTRLLLVAILAAVVGCAARTTNPPSPAASLRSSPEFAALAYMMEQHASFSQAERETYSAYVVPESPLGDAIVKAFANHTPPVSNSIKVDATSGEARNSSNGRPVKSWDAELVELNGDRAVVNVTWYSASLAAGGHRVELERRGGKWAVVQERMEWVS